MNTPTPWKVGKPDNAVVYAGKTRIEQIYRFDKDDTLTTSDIMEIGKANAELIVRAVNYHDRLVDMVEQLRADLKAARSALYIVGRLQEAQINSKSIQYSEQLLTEIKESK